MKPFRCVIAQHGGSAAIIASVGAVLRSIPDVECVTVSADETCSARADLVIICWGAAELHRLALLVAQCRGRDLERSVMIVGEFDDERPLSALFRLGVADFIKLPLSGVELRARVERALGMLACGLERPIAQWLGCEEPLLCSLSPRLNAQLARLPALAGQPGDVLVCGERGSGRRAFVRQLVRLTGGARPIEIDPELGAGADAERMLTTFLAESVDADGTAALAVCGAVLVVHDLELLSPHAQSLLLNLVQSPSASRGGRVRVCATAADGAGDSCDANSTLSELLKRLSALRVRMPPLRERRDDILPLARLFLARRCAELARPVPALTPAAARYLLTREWRGNVRELWDVISCSLQSTPSDLLGVHDLLVDKEQGSEFTESSLRQTKTQMIVSFERTFLEQLLQSCQGNIAKAARMTQKNRRALFELIRKHEIDVEKYRPTTTGPR